MSRSAKRKSGYPGELPLLRMSLPWLLGAFLLTSGYALWLLIGTPTDSAAASVEGRGATESMLAACTYALLLLGLTLAWGLKLRHASNRMLKEAHEVVEGAIRGEPRRMSFTESELSLLEHKLIRFAELSRERESEAAREKEGIQRLIADISHQTKTPLANMLLYTELLEERIEADSVAGTLIGQVRTQADKLHFLIRSLVDMSRLETGILKMNPGRYPLAQAAESAFAQAAVPAEAAAVRLVMNRGGGNGLPITAAYDPKWTAEALFNLLDNAIKYGRSGGTVTVSFSQGDVYACIEVSDDGPGIAAEERAEIFGRFRRGKSAAAVEGIGLGLYVAREIIQHQGGRIQVGSSPEGGALFRIFLPAGSAI